MLSPAEKGSGGTPWRVAAFVAILVVDLALLYKLVAQPGVDAGLLAGVVVVTGLLLISPRVYDIRRIEVGTARVLAEMNENVKAVDAKVSDVNEAVEQLNERIRRLFLATMSPGMYQNLEKLASGHFGPFVKSAGLDRELRHLRDHGYVEVYSVSNIPERGDDLSAYVKVADTGKTFVELRKMLDVK